MNTVTLLGLLLSMFSAHAEITQVTRATPLFESADLQSARYDVQPGQQLVIADDDGAEFLRANLLSTDGKIQLVGYVQKLSRSKVKKRGEGLCPYSMGPVQLPPGVFCPFGPGG